MAYFWSMSNSIHLSINLSIYLSVYLSFFLSIYLSVYILFIYLYTLLVFKYQIFQLKNTSTNIYMQKNIISSTSTLFWNLCSLQGSLAPLALGSCTLGTSFTWTSLGYRDIQQPGSHHAVASGPWGVNYRILKGPGGVQGEGVFLGNPEDSGEED